MIVTKLDKKNMEDRYFAIIRERIDNFFNIGEDEPKHMVEEFYGIAKALARYSIEEIDNAKIIKSVDMNTIEDHDVFIILGIMKTHINENNVAFDWSDGNHDIYYRERRAYLLDVLNSSKKVLAQNINSERNREMEAKIKNTKLAIYDLDQAFKGKSDIDIEGIEKDNYKTPGEIKYVKDVTKPHVDRLCKIIEESISDKKIEPTVFEELEAKIKDISSDDGNKDVKFLDLFKFINDSNILDMNDLIEEFIKQNKGVTLQIMLTDLLIKYQTLINNTTSKELKDEFIIHRDKLREVMNKMLENLLKEGKKASVDIKENIKDAYDNMSEISKTIANNKNDFMVYMKEKMNSGYVKADEIKTAVSSVINKKQDSEIENLIKKKDDELFNTLTKEQKLHFINSKLEYLSKELINTIELVKKVGDE